MDSDNCIAGPLTNAVITDDESTIWTTLILKNEVQRLRQTKQDKAHQDAAHMEFKSRRTELELEYWGVKLQEQKSKLKREQERHDDAMSERKN